MLLITPNDLSIMLNITRKMFERLLVFGILVPANTESNMSAKRSPGFRPLQSLIRYQKKGTGIATRVRLEVQAFSFVLLRAFNSHFGAPEFVDFNMKELKGTFSGCMSAMSGECHALLAVNFFNSDASDWEYAVEPFPFTLAIDQMPNELVRGSNVSLFPHIVTLLTEHVRAYRSSV
jgi:hypothetical protein